MANRPLDRPGIVGAAVGPWVGMPAGTVVGHVHLQVGGLDEAEVFYSGLLGFDVMCRYSGAVFFGSGGYHHQLAGNIWNSRNAPLRSVGATGLSEVALLADAAALEEVRCRSQDAILPCAEEGGALVLQDPWGTLLRLRP